MEGMVELAEDNGSHSKAYVVDVFDSSDKTCCLESSAPKTDQPMIVLRFDDKLRSIEAFSMSRIRLAPMASTANSGTNSGADRQKGSDLKEGDEVEALVSRGDGEVEAYWKCVIKTIKGDFYVVLFDNKVMAGSDVENQKSSEIIIKDKIRAVNTSPYLTSNPFYKVVIEVPKELIRLCREWISKPETHHNYKTCLSLIAINYNDSNDTLIGIGFAASEPKRYFWEQTRKTAFLLSEMHFYSLKVVFELKNQNKALKKEVNPFEEVVKRKDNNFEIIVKVDEDLIGFAIGSKGYNLKQVLSAPGVVAIDRKESMFKVIATSRETCLSAKEMLQIMERLVDIPVDVVSHIIGRGGQSIHDIIDTSGLRKIMVNDEVRGQSDEPCVPFRLIGTRQAIDNGLLLLDFQVKSIQENIEIDKTLYPKNSNKILK